MVLFSAVAFTQDFKELMFDPNANFYDVKRLAESYFEQNGTGKGTGYKHYKRWEYWAEKRTAPSGDLKVLYDGSFLKNYQQWKTNNSQRAISANWTAEGPFDWDYSGSWNPGVGRVNEIVEHPSNPNILFACVPSGGVWKTTNGGASWSCESDEEGFVGTSALAFDAGDENTIYLATGDRDAGDSPSYGVYKSTDGGVNWVQTALTASLTGSRIYDLKTHPTNANEVYAACQNGLFKSTDGGANWTEIFTNRVQDIEFKPGTPSTIYIVNNQSFYKSTNSGSTFTQMTSGLPTTLDRVLIEVTPANPNYVYFLYSDGSLYGGLCRSTNSGDSFATRSTQQSIGNIFGYSTSADDQDGQAWYDMAIAVSPSNAEEVHVGGIITWKSTNGGSSFTATTAWSYPNNTGYVHADIHYIRFYGNNLYVGSDGGVYKSTNNGSSFTDISNGLGIKQFYRFDLNTSANPILIGGAQDNGTSIKNASWIDWLGADGMDCAIDHSNNNVMYGSTQNGSFSKTTSGGGNSVNIDGNLSGPWVTPLTMDPNNSSILYAGTQQVQKTSNGMGSWSQVSSFSGSTNIQEIAVAKSNSNVVYVARGSDLFKSTNGGNSWTNVNSGLPNLSLSDVDIHPTNENFVVVSLSGGSAGQKCYRSTDGGVNWVNISSNLPNVSANSVAIDDTDLNSIYIAMDYGVYYIDDAENEWSSFSTNLPLVPTSELKVHHASDQLFCATYGRGIWKTDVHQPIQYALDAAVQIVNYNTILCNEEFIPMVNISNVGTDIVTSVSVDLEVAGSTYNQVFTTTLNPGESAEFSWGSLAVNEGSNTATATVMEVNATSDMNGENNTDDFIFTFISSPGSDFTVNIQPDNYGAEITWTLTKDETSEVVGTGTGPADGDLTMINETFAGEIGCYTLTMEDGYGDGICCSYGMGYVIVLNECGDTLTYSNGDYGTGTTLNFCISVADDIVEASNSFSVTPNPFLDVLVFSSNVNAVKVFDASGRLVLEKNQLISRTLDTNGLSKGTYFIMAELDNGEVKMVPLVK